MQFTGHVFIISRITIFVYCMVRVRINWWWWRRNIDDDAERPWEYKCIPNYFSSF